MPAWTIELSRVGFDAVRTRALVRVGRYCGGMCGDGQVLLMERGADGQWRMTWAVGSWIR